MKKIFLIIVIIITILMLYDTNNIYNKLYKKIEEETIYIDELYIYGRYLNITKYFQIIIWSLFKNKI